MTAYLDLQINIKLLFTVERKHTVIEHAVSHSDAVASCLHFCINFVLIIRLIDNRLCQPLYDGSNSIAS